MSTATSAEQSPGGESLRGPVTRMTIYVGESDTWHHRPLYAELVHRAHAAGLAGASVFRGLEGFGSSNTVHTSRLLSLSEDLPVAIVIIDTTDRVNAFLPQVEEVVGEGLVTLDEVTVMVHRFRPADS